MMKKRLSAGVCALAVTFAGMATTLPASASTPPPIDGFINAPEHGVEGTPAVVRGQVGPKTQHRVFLQLATDAGFGTIARMKTGPRGFFRFQTKLPPYGPPVRYRVYCPPTLVPKTGQRSAFVTPFTTVEILPKPPG